MCERRYRNTEKTETGTDVSRCVQETAAVHPIYSDKAHQKSMKSAPRTKVSCLLHIYI